MRIRPCSVVQPCRGKVISNGNHNRITINMYVNVYMYNVNDIIYPQ